MGSGLPLWAQWVWLSVSLVALGGGVGWTVFYVRGYMKRMELLTLELLRMGKESQLNFAAGSEELRKALEQLAEGMTALGTAQKMAMGVNVAASLLPMLISELAGVKGGKAKK